MAFEQFITKKFSATSRAIIEQANAIIDDYSDAGLKLTLRQLYVSPSCCSGPRFC